MARYGGSSTSSPDPLADSLNNASTTPSNPTRAVSITPKKPVVAANGNVRLQDFYLTTPPAGLLRKSSPTKSIAQTQNLLSPWRIHVTVEAEKDEGMARKSRSLSKSPSKRVTGRTVTTTIPLKGADDSSPVLAKRGRGRPRKSLDAPTKRSGTPIPRKSARRRTSGVEAVEALESSGTQFTPPKKPRGRPRKSLEVGTDNGDIFTDIASESQAPPGTTSATHSRSAAPPERKSKGRRKAMSPVKMAADSDISTNNDEIAGSLDLLSANTMPETQLPDPPASLSSEVEVNKRDEAQDPTDEHQDFDSIIESEGFSMVSVSSLPSVQQHLAPSTCVYEPNSGVLHGSTNASNLQYSPETHLDDGDTIDAEVSGLHELSCVSIDKINGGDLNTAKIVPTQPSPAFMDHSSRLYEIIQQRTPSLQFSSPSLPPPPQPVFPTLSPRALEQSTEGTPKLVRVVRAGTALQTALKPISNRSNTHSPKDIQHPTSADQQSPKERSDDIFSGFGAGTRRELRAGLRLGEELAKHQRAVVHAAAIESSVPKDVFQDNLAPSHSGSPSPQDKTNYALKVPESTRQVEYPSLPNPQLPSPEGSENVDDDDSMSWKADTPAKQELEATPSQTHSSSPIAEPEIDVRMLEREAEWQREREAVSKQIRDANTSQVIVIQSSTLGNDYDEMPEESDDEHGEEGELEEEEEEAEEESDGDEEDLLGGEGEETVDIWQTEAQQSSQLQPHTMTEGIDAILGEVVVKPRRSKLPSPWRRDNQVVYSDEAAPIEKHVAWQPNLKHAVTPQESTRRKRVRYESTEYSVLSESVGRPDDESSKILEEDSSSDEGLDQVTPSKSRQHSTRLTHAEYYDKVVEDLDDTWSLDQDDDRSQKPHACATMKLSTMSRPNRCEEKTIDMKDLPSQVQSPPRSWFSRITSFVPGLRNLIPSTSTAVNHAVDIAQPSLETLFPKTRSPPETNQVLSLYKPWTVTHYRALQPFYLAAKKDKSLYPYNPTSPSAWLRGRDIFSLGWKTVIQEWELGVVDAFLDMLDVYGVDDGEMDKDGRQRDLIDEREVMNRVFSLWVGQVQRQETPLGNATMGIFDPRHEWRRGAILKAANAGS
ncbi:hypothetical protein MMC13_002378 [Lambiella insularis]|nr:hypothetical protein [Lambiella insularis]